MSPYLALRERGQVTLPEDPAPLPPHHFDPDRGFNVTDADGTPLMDVADIGMSTPTPTSYPGTSDAAAKDDE